MPISSAQLVQIKPTVARPTLSAISLGRTPFFRLPSMELEYLVYEPQAFRQYLTRALGWPHANRASPSR